MLGGLLIMMGHQARSEAPLYYFRLEDQVPENHLLRLIRIANDLKPDLVALTGDFLT
jgi:predicted MPP superfamily phosphohydrolase